MEASSNASSQAAAGANPIRVFQNALAGDAPNPAANAYPLAIQGALGDGVYAQPYIDALSQLSLDTAPSQPQLYTVREGDTVSGIAGGDYAKMSGIAAANNLQITANGSPLLRTGQSLFVPNTAGSDSATQRRLDASGRNMVAANTQVIAQRQAAQSGGQNANLVLLNPNSPPRRAIWNAWGVPDNSGDRPGARSMIAAEAAQPFQRTMPLPRFSRQEASAYYTDHNGNDYFLKNDASGSRLVHDDRAQKYAQLAWDAVGRAGGYGADGQSGTGVWGSIGYSYPKYVFHASDDTANFLGWLGNLADDAGAGFSDAGPYRAIDSPQVESAPAGSEGPATQLGGAYKDVKGIPSYEAHHMPANSITPLNRGDGPSIGMTEADHRLTASHGSGSKAKAYRRLQADLIREGDFWAAQHMDIQDIQKKFGSKYDDAIQQMQTYSQDKGHW